MIPQGGSVNRPDSQRSFIFVENDVTTVMPPAKVSVLHTADYHVGIALMADGNDSKIILLGLLGNKKASGTRAIMLRFSRVLFGISSPDLYRWSTEYWVSDSVVVDAGSIEETDLMTQAVRAGHSDTKAYICLGLPATIFGPLFNTLMSHWNANAACFYLSIGFIWIAAAVDPRFAIERKIPSHCADNTILSMLNEMNGKSWLVEAKLTFRLEKSTRMKAAILVELLGIADIRITSTHKPIIHS
ncbi:hypothetical protein N7476_000337 [Penicillium atrosanguineum]|uniref:Uncharacterized protein n=1 Tax=Penicillium atrosanguineum TaxID=1132637 RepID=A0A9W9QBA2_9EURO|nr:hypothetical protein N7476_000337 [Penicillium atrosanguineum]